MSIDNLTRPQLEQLLERIKTDREWKHLPQSYRIAGHNVRQARDRGDLTTEVRYVRWATTAILTEHPSNQRMAKRLFEGKAD